VDLRRTLLPLLFADVNHRLGGLTGALVGALFCASLATAATAADSPIAGSTKPDSPATTASSPIAPVTLPATLPTPQESGAKTTPANASGSPADTMSATDAYAAFRSAFDAGKYLDAVPPAQRVLALAEQTHKDPTDEDIQVAVMNLAMTQYLAGDYGGAEENYKRAIQLVQDSGRPLHQRLARAYAGLATTYHDGNRHDLAVKNYDQAVALLRRHEGLLTETQIPIVQKYIDSLTELGRLNDALQAQRYILRIVTRKYGENDIRVAPTLVDIGRWFTRVGAYDLARSSLKRATNIIEAADGDKSPKLVDPLMAVAACAHKQMLDPTQVVTANPDTARPLAFQDPNMPVLTYTPATLYAESERALQRAADIADQRADPVPAQVADVHTQLGDLYQARGLADRALPHYQKAWQAASRVTQKYSGKALTAALFGDPVLLQISRPESWDKYSQRPKDEVELRYVRVEFTVTPQGRADDWKVTDDAGDPKRAERTIDALKTAHYRPRFDNGQPVSATGTVLSQPWYVLLQPEGSKPANAKQSNKAGARRAAQ
jgi:tetratricopeptide (TPR) repeat protein